MYTEILYLVTKEHAFDSVGNNIPGVSTLVKTYAKLNKVGTREFYNAVEIGIRPEYELQIKKVNYNDENYVNYNGKAYDVIRTLPKNRTDMVLVIGKKVGNI